MKNKTEYVMPIIELKEAAWYNSGNWWKTVWLFILKSFWPDFKMNGRYFGGWSNDNIIENE